MQTLMSAAFGIADGRTLIGADFFILQVLVWIGVGGWDADAFATAWQKPLIAGRGSRKIGVV